jgi:hypothetical protein
MYGNQPTAANYVPNPVHSHNPAPGHAIKVQRYAPGVYQVTFVKLAPVTGQDANVQVTPYGNGTANCHVQGWSTLPGPDFDAFVRCYATTTGVNIDSEHTLLVTFQ